VRNLDVVFIHPPAWVSSRPLGRLLSPFIRKMRVNRYPIMPMGLLSLASCLDEEGFQTRITNFGLEQCLNPSFDLRKRVKRINANVYAIDLHWSVHSSGAVGVAKLCKGYHPDSLVVLGGFTSTWFDREIIRNHPYVDVVVRGEAERPMLQLVKNFFCGKDFGNIEAVTYRSENSITKNPMGKPASNLDEFDFIRPELVENWDAYLKVNAVGYNERAPPTFWLPIARGCPHNCIHCGGSSASYCLLTGRDKPVLRSPEKVAEDIEKLGEKGVKAISFSHDPQIGGEGYYSNVLEEIQKRGIDVSAYTEIFHLPSREFIAKYAETFTYSSVAVSPESASEEVRNLAGKPFSNVQLLEALGMLDRSGINTLVYFCIGLPKESLESFEMFKEMVRRIMYDMKHVLVAPPFPYIIDPNSLMALHPEKYGVKLFLKTFEDYKRMSKTAGSWAESIGHETSNLSRDDIHKLTVEAHEHVARILRLRGTEPDFASWI